MATNCERDSFSSASLLLSVDYRCFRPSSPFLPAELLSGAESAPFNAALQFKRPVTCTTELPTLPTAAELECIGKTFKWDLFQLIAAGCILQGESVLVCAHTSSGKTVVGEFAVARALAAGQRILLDVTRARSKHDVTSFSCTLRPSRRFPTRSSGSSVKPSDLRRFAASQRQRRARARGANSICSGWPPDGRRDCQSHRTFPCDDDGDIQEHAVRYNSSPSHSVLRLSFAFHNIPIRSFALFFVTLFTCTTALTSLAMSPGSYLMKSSPLPCRLFTHHAHAGALPPRLRARGCVGRKHYNDRQHHEARAVCVVVCNSSQCR